MLPEIATEIQDANFSMIVCQKVLVDDSILITPLSGADEVSWESWNLVTAIHDDSDGLILCD